MIIIVLLWVPDSIKSPIFFMFLVGVRSKFAYYIQSHLLIISNTRAHIRKIYILSGVQHFIKWRSPDKIFLVPGTNRLPLVKMFENINIMLGVFFNQNKYITFNISAISFWHCKCHFNIIVSEKLSVLI